MDRLTAERLVRFTTTLIRGGYEPGHVQEAVLANLDRIGTTPLAVLEEEFKVARANQYLADLHATAAATAEERQRNNADAFR